MSNTNTPHYVGETGVELILNCGMNVTHAEVLQILVKKPKRNRRSR